MSGIIPDRESMTVEFKSDVSPIGDDELLAAVVCMANADGGTIYLGVEDNGRVTGLSSKHHNLTGLAAMVAARTIPPLAVRVSGIPQDDRTVAKIEVPKSTRIVATSRGLVTRRRIQADGTPECVPYYPHEFDTRASDLGMLDYSARPVIGASVKDLDPLELNRLRRMIEQLGGDRNLLALRDEELTGALALTRCVDGIRVPTVAGLLLLANEESLREHVPTHEVAFQVLEGPLVRVNDFYRTPLLRVYERVLEQFRAWLRDDEVMVRFMRIPVPNYDESAFREAFVNALVHRDYTRLGAVHIRWEQDCIVVSNPGGFVEGVTLSNLLVTEPRARNPVLADTFKRIGLAERTGRGIDNIYRGLLRYGRSAPDYSRSDAVSVVLRLPGGKADEAFVQLVVNEENRRGMPVPLDSLIALSELKRQRRIDTAHLAHAIQRDEATARATLEQLVESGLAEAHGVKKGRTYTLSAQVYRELGQPEDYIRQTGFEPIQQENMVIRYVQAHGRITRGEAAELCRISPYRASRLLSGLSEDGRLVRQGAKRGTYYELSHNSRARS